MQSDRDRAIQRILAVRMDNLGDIVMLTPALRALRKAYPKARISLLASPAGSQVAPLLPWIDEVIVWRATWQEVSAGMLFDLHHDDELLLILKSKRFDLALIFTSFTQSPYPPAYACYLAGIPVRVGLSNEFGGQILSHWDKPPAESGHQVDRNLAVIHRFEVPENGKQMELHVPSATAVAVDDLCASYKIDTGSRWVVVAPGASCQARRYPVERFRAVIEDLSTEIDLPILILGSDKEQERLRSLKDLAKTRRVTWLVGKTSVPEMVEMIHRAGLVIANNSASLHIADAFHIPQVILYSGSEYRSQWAPRFSPAILLRRETHCSPCYRFDCIYDLNCLDIEPREVVHAAEQLLAHEQYRRNEGVNKSGSEEYLLVNEND